MDLEEIFRAHQREVFVYLLRVVGDQHRAEDLAQETFVRAMESLVRYRGDASLRTWLFAIARTTMADYFRKSRRESFEEPPEPEVAHDTQKRLEIEDALRELPPALREAIVLCDVLGFEPTEAAAVADVTANAFRVRLHRARARSREVYARG